MTSSTYTARAGTSDEQEHHRGMGMGVDWLVTNLTGLGVRDTIPFPIPKPN